MPDIVTYESLYEILRKEKVSQELQPLDKTFFEKLFNYLKEKQKLFEAHEKKSTQFPIDLKRAQKELENIKRMIRELYERREHKILTLATFASRSGAKDTSNMLNDEKKMFDEIVAILSIYRQGTVESIITLTRPQVTQPQTIKADPLPTINNKLIRFIKPVPKFLDEDLNVVGPFDTEDVANIPGKIADILIKNKRAEEIKNEANEKNASVLPAL